VIWNLTFLGILIVFLVLGILYVFFILMGRLFSKKKPVILETKRGIYTVPSAPVTREKFERKEEENFDELAVVIASAVAAYVGESRNFRLKSFRPVEGPRTNPWKFRTPVSSWKARGWKRHFDDGLRGKMAVWGGRRR